MSFHFYFFYDVVLYCIHSAFFGDANLLFLRLLFIVPFVSNVESSSMIEAITASCLYVCTRFRICEYISHFSISFVGFNFNPHFAEFVSYLNNKSDF